MTLSIKKKKIDMLEGNLLNNLLVYSLPLVFSGLLQLLFNAADMAVVGKFTGSAALAAVSAASPIASLIVTLFMGLSTGVNVLLAQMLGANDQEGFQSGVHTSIAASFIMGILLMIAGEMIAKPLLVLIATPDNILPLALVYLRIYLIGVPSMLVYNFGAAVLRAYGDTKRPLIYMMTAGILNVVFNLFFVICFSAGAAGVAIATALSQTIAAVLVIHFLIQTDTVCHLEKRLLHINYDILKKMLQIGIPSGLQGAAFSIANLLIQAAINSFGPVVMAASAVCMNIDSFCYVGVDALGQGALTFTSQNYGAGNMRRIRQIFHLTMTIGISLEFILGILCYIFYSPVLSIFTNDSAVIAAGREIMFPICVFGFVNASMNIPFHIVRGMGHSLFPMICTVLFVCVLRVIWVYAIFPLIPTIGGLYAAWPVTKGITSIAAAAYYCHIMKQR